MTTILLVASIALQICFFIINHFKHLKVMATLAELQQAVTDLQTSVDTKQQAIADAIKALEGQIAAGGSITEADLQPIVDSLKATQADVDSTPTA